MKYVSQIAFSLLLAVSSVSTAYSCSCNDQSQGEKFRKADVIFLGQITAVSEHKPISKDDYFNSSVTFKVEKQWKGSKKSAISVLFGADVPGMCGDMPLVVGQRYLIYAFHEKDELTSYADCGPNVRAEDAKSEIKNLNSSWFRLRSRLWRFS